MQVRAGRGGVPGGGLRRQGAADVPACRGALVLAALPGCSVPAGVRCQPVRLAQTVRSRRGNRATVEPQQARLMQRQVSGESHGDPGGVREA